MSRGNKNISQLIDEVVADAALVGRVSEAEHRAIKVAEAMPKTAMARQIRVMAEEVRTQPDDFTYNDLWSLL